MVGKTVIDYGEGNVRAALRAIWAALQNELTTPPCGQSTGRFNVLPDYSR